MTVKRYKNLRGVVFNIAQGTGKPSIPIINSNFVELDHEIAEKYPSWFEEMKEEKQPNIGQSFDDFVEEDIKIPVVENMGMTPVSEEIDDSVAKGPDHNSSEIEDDVMIEIAEENKLATQEEIIDQIEDKTREEEFDTFENIMSIAEKIKDVKHLHELAENYDIKLDARKKLKGSMTQFKKELTIKFEKE